MAPAAGAWHNPETNEIIEESVTLIHSYASVDANNDGSKFLKIAEFLHRMGRETKQGEIGIVIDGVFHRITRFQKAAKS